MMSLSAKDHCLPGCARKTAITCSLLLALAMHLPVQGQNTIPATAPEAAAAVAADTVEKARPDTNLTSISSGKPAKSPYNWQRGPAAIKLLNQALLNLPPEYEYLVGPQAQQLLRTLGNPNVENVQAVVTGVDRDWIMVVRWEASGYIRETHIGHWDMDALLNDIRQGSNQSNQARRTQRVAELEVLGWLEQPDYDAQRHKLTWGIAVRNQGEKEINQAAINYNTFVLGREGYVTLNLITSLAQLDKNRPHANRLLSAFEFEEGKRYSDYTTGDKTSSSGLSALISNAAPDEQAAEEKSFFSTTVMVALLAALTLLALIGAGAWFWLRRRNQSTPTLSEVVDDESPDQQQASAGSAAS